MATDNFNFSGSTPPDQTSPTYSISPGHYRLEETGGTACGWLLYANGVEIDGGTEGETRLVDLSAYEGDVSLYLEVVQHGRGGAFNFDFVPTGGGGEELPGAWVPLAEGSYPFEFTDPHNGEYSGVDYTCELVDSTVLMDAPAGGSVMSDWELQFTGATPPKVRITISGYLAGENREGAIYRTANFESLALPENDDFDRVVYNEAAPYPLGNFQDDGGVNTFEPGVLVITNEENPIEAVTYLGTRATSDSIRVDQTYNMLIEVWVQNAGGGFWTDIVGCSQTEGPAPETPEM